MKSNPSSEETEYIAVPVDDSDVQKPKKGYMNSSKPFVGFLASCAMQRIVMVLLLVGATLTMIHPCSHHKKSMQSKTETIDPMHQHDGMGPHLHPLVPPPPIVKNSSEDSEDSSDDSDDPMEWISGVMSWFAGDSGDDSADDRKHHHHMGPPPHHMDHPPMDPDHHHMGPHHHTFDPPPMKYPFPKMDVIEKKTVDSPEDSEDSLNSMDSLDKEDSLDSKDSSNGSDDPWEWMGDMWDWLTGEDDSSDDSSDDSEDNATHWINKAWSWMVLDSSDDSGDEFSNSTSED
jgi:hypothetical protein